LPNESACNKPGQQRRHVSIRRRNMLSVIQIELVDLLAMFSLINKHFFCIRHPRMAVVYQQH